MPLKCLSSKVVITLSPITSGSGKWDENAAILKSQRSYWGDQPFVVTSMVMGRIVFLLKSWTHDFGYSQKISKMTFGHYNVPS